MLNLRKFAIKGQAKLFTAVSAFTLVLLTVFLLFNFNASRAEESSEGANIFADENENGEKYLEIVASNIAYEDCFHIAYAVRARLDLDMDFTEMKMLFWSCPQNEYIIGNQSHIADIANINDNNGSDIVVGEKFYPDCAVFLSSGISAKEIGDTVYARAYIKDSDGNIYYSNVTKHSILDYIYSRYRDAEDGGVSENQITLYKKILEYGANAQAVFNYKTDRLVTDKAVRIEVGEGSLSDGFTSGVFFVGDSVTLIAEPLDFVYWVDSKGNIVSNNSTYTFTVEDTTVSETYTSVYTGRPTITVTGGTVNGTDGVTLKFGTEYTVTAEVPQGYKFNGWSVNGEASDLPVSFTAVAEADVNYTASFTLKTDDRYDGVDTTLDAEAFVAMKNMEESIFSEDLYLWAAELYDPETGGFYFSISGRDNYGYLPDLESTNQALGLLSKRLGLGELSTLLNAEQKARLLSWTQTLQSNRDGYYYHPHWGISVIEGRRSRDNNNSNTCYSPSGSLAYRLFDDAFYRLTGGTSGNKGATESVEYNNSQSVKLTSELTMPLGISPRSAVSRVLSTASSVDSSMPVHLQSVTNYLNHLNSKWNDTCKLSGTHERHICSSSCVIVPDANDSYMKITDGEAEFVRGYRCTSCHTCQHTVGHSYPSSIHTPLVNEAIAAGFGDLPLRYLNDIQENVQCSLRSQGKPENGLYEEEITYDTINGFLKNHPAASQYGQELKYAEAAFYSTLQIALMPAEQYGAENKEIINIYNPYAALEGILDNIEKYGSDPTLAERLRAEMRSQAAVHFENITDKLMGYKMPDGGFSYSYSGYCTTSQSQPVAVEGWNGGVGEGDLNGNSLVFLLRNSIYGCLGISVDAPFAGDNNYIDGGFDLNGDGDKSDSFDLDLDGVAEVFEATCTHTQRFQYLITTKELVTKADASASEKIYDFEGQNPEMPTEGSIATDGTNKVLQVVDNNPQGGLATAFLGREYIGSEEKTVIKLDMRINSSNTTTTHQIISAVFIDFAYNSTSKTLSFTNRINGGDIREELMSGIDASDWINIELNVYPNRTGMLKVTPKGGNTVSAALTGIYSDSAIDSLRILSLNTSVTDTYYDNVSCIRYIKTGVYDGEYHFDTASQQISDSLVQNPAADVFDRVYPIEKSSVTFDAFDYSVNSYKESLSKFNFNSSQLDILLSDAKDGDRIDLAMLDNYGTKITGIYLIVSEQGTNKRVTFYAPNGDVLEESVPRAVTGADGKVSYKQELRPMVLDVDSANWLTVKLEYHYDMAKPQFDIVVRYADNAKNGYYTTTAATLTNVDVCDFGAYPYKFAELSVKATGKIYLDDLFIRNVYDDTDLDNEGACPSHVYIEKVSNSYLTGESENGHNLYYRSCRRCGEKDMTQTFVCHTYGRAVDEAYKIADASIYSAAIYFESCSVCGETSDKVFTVGLPLNDESKWNFASSGSESGLPSYTSVQTGNGKWATLKSETVDGKVNYYMNIGKKDATGTNNFVLTSPTAGASAYIYELDFRWGSADDHLEDIIYVKSGLSKNGSRTHKLSHGYIKADNDGDFATYNGVAFYPGDWHNLKYLFEKNGSNWELTVFIDGVKINSYSFEYEDGAVPYVLFETRWSNLELGGVNYPNNVNFDVDRLKTEAVFTEGHEYSEIPTAENFVGKNEDGNAVFCKSCKRCGEKSEETFAAE